MKFRMLALAAGFAAATAFAKTSGTPAPDFTVTDVSGKPVKLSEFKGKYVVLEWTNPECPFVRNQSGTRSLQTRQARWGMAGVVWVTNNPTTPKHS
jgi:hypothetical protein